MKRYIVFVNILLVWALIFGLFAFAKAQNFKERKIVVFKSDVDEKLKEVLLTNVGAEKIKDLRLVSGKAVWLSKKEEIELLKSGKVLRIDPDVEVYALEDFETEFTPGYMRIWWIKPQPSQIITWNIERVGATSSWAISTGDPVKVGVIDTGIDLKHPDLKANIKGGYNAINPLKSYTDDHGHGTHVAGIIAALNNSIGVVGVGPNIDLYAIKFLNAKG